MAGFKLAPKPFSSVQSVSKPLNTNNVHTVRWALYDNEPGAKPNLLRPTTSGSQGKRRYRLELQLWTDNHMGKEGNIKRSNYLGNPKVFRQVKDYTRLEAYRNWYVEKWEKYKNLHSEFAGSDMNPIMGFCALGQREQNTDTQRGLVITPMVTAFVVLADGYAPHVFADINDVEEDVRLGKKSEFETYTLNWDKQ